MPNPLKKLESMYDIIFEAVTKKREAVQETAKKCKQLFKQKNSSADPEVLTQLEESLRARQDEQALAKRINQSKQGNSPKTPDELKESLKKQRKDYECYIRNFLPALLQEIIKSRKLKLEKIEEIVGIISDAIKQSGKEEYERFKCFLSKLETELNEPNLKAIIMKLKISDDLSKSSDKDHPSSTIQNQNGRRNNQIDRQDNATRLFKNKSFSSEVAIAASSGSSALERDSLAKGVSGKGTPGKYNTMRSSGYNSALTVPPLGQVRTLEASKETSLNPIQLNDSFSQSCEDLENKEPSTIADAVKVLSGASTSKLSSGNDSDSGIDSPRKSEESLESPISSRRSSMSSTEENNNSQKGDTGLLESNLESPKENESQVQPKQAAPEEPQVEESGNSDGQEGKIPSQVKGELKSNGEESEPVLLEEEPKLEEQKKEAVLSKQETSNNENNSEVKQPNNRNLHVALIAGCALSTIGCIVAGAMTSGLIGAGLLAMAAVFAIAAVAELHSNFLSSKLTSISVEPHVNDKELTACSRL